ncbi:cell division protein FtsX [Allocatelliglobosispora scoriae]|uniref:Cell division protein FtsX n=1 Tax=Allocatelliglobosispora scoriae TaxID=643052 RepID=A0A841BLY1_9ACTN|nr:FtsX-like permease family protein [Allocatelliglobosispora scoriae]MBB5867830.1 cell division protein FtsX [Allocatelliglobosispora scoriae]
MIGLGLRLVLASGREAAVRLLVIAVAVGVGTGLLLAVLACINATHAQNARFGWLNTAVAPPAAYATADPMWWSLSRDYFDGQTIGRVDVAAIGPHAPVPPGIPRLPGPGEYYASPALSALLHTTPAAQLADRFAGHEIGTMGAAALPSPDSLLVIVGRTPAEASRLPFAKQVTRIMTADPGNCAECYVGTPAAGMELVLGVVAVALLFPVLIFIGTATRLAATRREQRFAAMRLVGATPGQIAVLSAVESGLAAVVGTGLGFALFLTFRDPLAEIPFTGVRFFTDDLNLNVIDALAVVVGIPLGTVLAARLALRRVQISPLGVTRQITRRPPRPRRLILLVVGVAELVLILLAGHPRTTTGQLTAYLSGIFLIMVGLVVAGPWLTLLGSRMLAGRASRAATLIAGRRLADNPAVAFRAVSGLMLALFVTSVTTGVISTFVAYRASSPDNAVAHTSMQLVIWPRDLAPGQAAPQAAQVPAGLASIPGVRSVNVVYLAPDYGKRPVGPPKVPRMPALTACAGLPPEFGSCPPGAQVAAVQPNLVAPGSKFLSAAEPAAWDAAPFSVDDLRKLPLVSVVVGTDGSTAALEQSRTLLEIAFPGTARPPATETDVQSDTTGSLDRYQQLANVVILASLPIAGCSLAVSVISGLTDRRRPFSLLRLAGMRLAELRRVVLLECAVPLLTVAMLAIGMGFLTAELFLRTQFRYTLVSPGPTYLLLVAAGLAGSLGIIASTMPLLRRITGPETVRNE